MEKLTARQEYILQVIKKLVAKNGYPPTVREIGAQAHLNSPATILCLVVSRFTSTTIIPVSAKISTGCVQ